MAAFFTGVVRAPVTGIVLVVEMTGNATMLLPMLLRNPPSTIPCVSIHCAWSGKSDSGELGATKSRLRSLSWRASVGVC